MTSTGFTSAPPRSQVLWDSPRFKYFDSPEFETSEDFELTTLGFVHVPPGADYPPPGHPEGYAYRWDEGRVLTEYQIHFITHGIGSLECDSGRARKHSILPGSTFLLFPKVWHRYAPVARTGWSEFWIGLRGGRVEQLMSSQAISEAEPLPALSNAQFILGNFVRALSTLDCCDPLAREVRRAAAVLILAELNASARAPARARLSLADRVTQFLSENGTARVGMEDFARRLGIGYHALRKQFKEETGCSLREWRNVLRLRKAATLLRCDEASVKEVASQCGFDDPYYFSRAFRKYFGVSPLLYRKPDI